MTDEVTLKQQKLAAFLDRHGLDGVILTHRNNFAWITGGRDNHIANSTPVGVASILATRDGKRVCLANTIEAPRMRDEELAGTGIEVIDFPWWDPAATRKTLGDLIGGRKIAADSDPSGLDLPPLPGDFSQLRWQLTPHEIERYRDGGRRTSAAVEAAARAVKPGMTEHEVAGLIDHHVHAAGCNPVVTLVASDDRIRQFRHPIPTGRKVQTYAMLVSCAEFGGLISCLTRFVHFGKLPDDLKARQHAIVNIDTAVNLATRPGRTLGEVFADLQAAYAAYGHDGQWKYHHQGGSTGYAGREALGRPGIDVRVLPDQAFAWNPSITGTKCEDTVLCTDRGIEVLTPHSSDWPTLEGRCAAGTLRRPDMLVF